MRLPTRFASLLLLVACSGAGCATAPAERDPEGAREPARTAARPAPSAEDERALDPPPPQDEDAEDPGVDPRLGDYARERTLQEQEKKALAENYFRSGRNLYQQLRYEEAVAHLRRAVALDPDHLEARQLLERSAWITGDERAGRRDAVREIAEDRMARIQQAKFEMDRLFAEGELLMKQQRYDAAVERFQRVLEAVRWFPYDIDREERRRRTEAAIEQARKLADEQEARRRQMLQEAARQAAEHEKENARRFIELQIKSLVENAAEALRSGNYDRAERLADDVLDREPDHLAARQLKAQAREARHRDLEIRGYRQRVEHLRRQVEWVDSTAIPYQDLFQFPARDAWMEIAQRDVQITDLLARQQQSEEAIEITRRLDSQRITLNFDQTPFDDALNFLRDITGLNYVVAKGAQELIDNEDVAVGLRLRNITLKNALNLILAAHEDLTWKVDRGVVLITTKTDSKADLYLEFYDVTEIVSSPPDFPAPELGLNLASGGGGGGGGGAVGGVLNFDDGGEEQGPRIDWEKLVELIESKLGEEEEDGSVEFSGGILIVRKPLSAHQKIIKLLDALRRTVGVMVTVEAKFVQVQDNELEAIGIDLVNQSTQNFTTGPFQGQPIDHFGLIRSPRASGGQGPGTVPVGYNYTDAQGQTNVRAAMVNALSSLAPPGLPFNISNAGGIALQYNFLETFQIQAMLEAVRKTQKVSVVNAPRITVFNGQRSHILNVSQRAYIQDVEVNQTGVIPVLNPVIGIINTGAILEVRPTVSHDRRYVTLEVKPTLATPLQSRIPAPVTLAGGNTSIPIELPVVTIQKLRTTVTIPDGGTVLLGGLKSFNEYEAEAGVPLLMKVPVLKNLFRRQQWQKLRASLVVLLRAEITIIREEEKKRFGTE